MLSYETVSTSPRILAASLPDGRIITLSLVSNVWRIDVDGGLEGERHDEGMARAFATTIARRCQPTRVGFDLETKAIDDLCREFIESHRERGLLHAYDGIDGIPPGEVERFRAEIEELLSRGGIEVVEHDH